MPNANRSIDDMTASVASQIRNGQQQVMEQVITMIDALRADMQAQQGALAMPQKPRIMQQAPRQGFPFGDRYTFGLKVNGATVTVYEGMATRAFDPSSPYYSDTTSVKFTSVDSDQLICWKFIKSAETFSIMSSPQLDLPDADDDNIYGVVASFDVTDPGGGAPLILALSLGGELQTGSPVVIDPWAPMPTYPNNKNLFAGTDASGKTSFKTLTGDVDVTSSTSKSIEIAPKAEGSSAIVAKLHGVDTAGTAFAAKDDFICTCWTNPSAPETVNRDITQSVPSGTALAYMVMQFDGYKVVLDWVRFNA